MYTSFINFKTFTCIDMSQPFVKLPDLESVYCVIDKPIAHPDNADLIIFVCHRTQAIYVYNIEMNK